MGNTQDSSDDDEPNTMNQLRRLHCRINHDIAITQRRIDEHEITKTRLRKSYKKNARPEILERVCILESKIIYNLNLINAKERLNRDIQIAMDVDNETEQLKQYNEIMTKVQHLMDEVVKYKTFQKEMHTFASLTKDPETPTQEAATLDLRLPSVASIPSSIPFTDMDTIETQEKEG